MKKCAFISAKNKDGLLEFVMALSENSYEIIADSDTAVYLRENGVAVFEIHNTDFDSNLHKAILVDRSNPDEISSLLEKGIEPVDVVVVNMLNPVNVFGVYEDFYSVMDNLDFGASSALRSAVKNVNDVVAVTSSADYEIVLSEIRASGEVSKDTKLALCHKAIDYLCRFDSIISDYMKTKVSTFAYPEIFNSTYDKVSDLTEEVNSAHTAALYKSCLSDSMGLCDMKLLCGPSASFNTYRDIDFAVQLLKEFKGQNAAIISKHSTVCGVAVADELNDAFVKASRTDSISCNGAIIVLGGEVDKKIALEIIKNPYHAVVALSYEEEALDICSSKEGLSVFAYDVYASDITERKFEVMKIQGGLLMRNVNNISVTVNESQCVTDIKPDEQQILDLMFAWKIIRHTKGDSVIVVKDGQTVGVSTGQTNRITACNNAVSAAGNKSEKAILATNVSIEHDEVISLCVENKIASIIQPGGSAKDEELISSCNEAEISMLMTNVKIINP
ncbi:MAG: hypothetical protein J6A69_01380 [Clostridia bacterium]|nr:hypothetical protein [Clostridia bacterium]